MMKCVLNFNSGNYTDDYIKWHPKPPNVHDSVIHPFDPRKYSTQIQIINGSLNGELSIVNETIDTESFKILMNVILEVIGDTRKLIMKILITSPIDKRMNLYCEFESQGDSVNYESNQIQLQWPRLPTPRTLMEQIENNDFADYLITLKLAMTACVAACHGVFSRITRSGLLPNATITQLHQYLGPNFSVIVQVSNNGNNTRASVLNTDRLNVIGTNPN